MATETESLTFARGATRVMQASVRVFTDRAHLVTQLDRALRPELERLGYALVSALPAELPGAVQPGTAVVIDAGAAAYDEDELLAHLGLCRALGAVTGVLLPPDSPVAAIDDLLDDLCGGLVARRESDLPRVATGLARRAGALARRRFEYLTVSPKGGALLAILADGTCALLARPIDARDDGTDVVDISIADDARSATIELASEARFELKVGEVRPNGARLDAPGSMSAAEVLAQIDGPTLGGRIRSLRLAAGLTQAELARRTGIHRPNIARVEAGRHTPSLETIARLAAAIGVPATRVLQG